MRESGLLSKYALVLAGACVPVAWLALPAGVAQAQEAVSPAPDRRSTIWPRTPAKNATTPRTGPEAWPWTPWI